MLEETDISCPYCGEVISILIEQTDYHQQYTEDCQVCCRPIVILAEHPAGGTVRVEARREDDA